MNSITSILLFFFNLINYTEIKLCNLTTLRKIQYITLHKFMYH